MHRLGSVALLLARLGTAMGAPVEAEVRRVDAEIRQIEVEVRRVEVDAETGSPVVRLREKAATHRELPIWVGLFEAQAIALEMAGAAPSRPLTHDLMRQLVDRLGGKLERVEIGDLRDNTYFATLRLVGRNGSRLAVDARPSDAIALALRLHGPIVVAEDVFAKTAAGQPSPIAARFRGLTIQTLTPEMAAFFDAPRGVLVADVAGDAAANGEKVKRGDVITAVDDAPVASVEELAARVGAHPEGERVRLSIRREGQPLTVELVD
jgi:bifunctional DNase/RNase